MQKKKAMKKKADWITKAKKRKAKKKDRGIVDFMMIIHHFFRELPKWIDEMKDPRNLSYTTYTQSDLVLMGVLKNVCAVKAMRSMEEEFNEETCIETLRLLSGDKNLKEMPHYDTLNYYLEKLSTKCLSDVRKKMVKGLIRMKSFCRSKLFGEHWRVIIDGTGLFYFKEKHCENCLVTTVTRETEDGKETKAKRYYHKVLEAKLVLAPDIIISLDTEFIENENEEVSKNDCEINAAKRLLERLHKDYPRLPVCLQGDALYAAGTIMKICRDNGWKYILTQKDSRQKVLAESYADIQGVGGADTVQGIGKEHGTGEYINHVEETAGKKETANMYRYWYETINKDGEKEVHEFQWITNIEITAGNLGGLVEAGRGRWKIEEAFNNQKNGIYDIEHLNSRNSNAMKNHYLITQMADVVMQMYLAWNPLIKEINQTIKNTSSRLRESFRQHNVTDEDVLYIQRYTTVYLE